jgi:hypothetical protein
MERKVLVISLIMSVFILLFISTLVGYEVATTYQAHATFKGYCHWRGLEVVNQSSDYGYCKDAVSGPEYKIVLVNERWYLDCDLPNNWSF